MADQVFAHRLRTDHIVIHCSASKASADIGAAEIERWHRERGFAGIGYHFVIRRSGEVEEGRSLDTIGAHAAGYNSRSVGVCLVGGIGDSGAPKDNFTRQQWISLRRVVVQLNAQYPNAAIVGHRDLPGVAKDCPCFDVRPWWAQIQNEINQ